MLAKISSMFVETTSIFQVNNKRRETRQGEKKEKWNWNTAIKGVEVMLFSVIMWFSSAENRSTISLTTDRWTTDTGLRMNEAATGWTGPSVSRCRALCVFGLKSVDYSVMKHVKRPVLLLMCDIHVNVGRLKEGQNRASPPETMVDGVFFHIWVCEAVKNALRCQCLRTTWECVLTHTCTDPCLSECILSADPALISAGI